MQEGPAPSGPRSCKRYRFCRRGPDGLHRRSFA